MPRCPTCVRYADRADINATLSIPRQFPLPPMVILAVGEDTLDVAVQSLHHADPRMHRRAATFGRHDQHLNGRLPLRVLLLGLRQRHDEVGGVLERDQLATVRQGDRVLECTAPARFSGRRRSRSRRARRSQACRQWCGDRRSSSV
jgi:hypothetical protein